MERVRPRVGRGGEPREVAKTSVVAGLRQAPGRAEQALSAAEAVSQWHEAAAALPDVGTEFVGFHLLEELGRGAFGACTWRARATSPPGWSR